jgi:hypothetical protein
MQTFLCCGSDFSACPWTVPTPLRITQLPAGRRDSRFVQSRGVYKSALALSPANLRDIRPRLEAPYGPIGEAESPAEEQANNLRGLGGHGRGRESLYTLAGQFSWRTNATSQRPQPVDHLCDRFFVVGVASPHDGANTLFKNRWVSPNTAGPHRWSTTSSCHDKYPSTAVQRGGGPSS